MVVQAGGYMFVFQAQCLFDHAGYPSRAFGVAKIRFHRADFAVITGRAIFTQHGTECLDLDRVSGARTRAMRFYILYFAWRNSRIPICFAQ